jgi:colanic acid/amylovoran biosynthesis glycosyltransferase
MKKILLFTSSFPFGNGESFLIPELEAMSAANLEVLVVPYYHGGNKTIREIPSGIKHLDVPLVANKTFIKFLKGILLYPWLNVQMLGEFFSKRVGLSIRRFKAWVVPFINTPIALHALIKRRLITDESVCYFYWGNNAALLVPLIKRIYKKVPCIVRSHGSDLYDYLFDGYLPLRSSLYTKCESLVFVSNMGMEYCIDKYKTLNTDKISVCRLGSRNPIASAVQDTSIKKRIVSCSNMIQLKNVDKIAKVVGMLPFDVEWHHFGDGPCMPLVKRIAQDQSNNFSYVLHGHVSNAAIHAFYSTNKVDLFINLSESEGLPVSIMEALSYGIPVCATDVGGIKEIVDNTVGILIEKNTIQEEIVQKVETFLKQSITELNEYSFRARQLWNEKYNAYVNAEKFINDVIGLYARK